MAAGRRFLRMLGAARQTSVVGVIGSVVGGSDTGSVIGTKLVPATGAEFFGFFSRARSSPSAATSYFLDDGSRFGVVFLRRLTCSRNTAISAYMCSSRIASTFESGDLKNPMNEFRFILPR